MKKIYYIFLVAFLFEVVSCDQQSLQTALPEDEATVTIDMNVSFLQAMNATKGPRADKPAIDNIYVAVFGSNHYLNDYVRAVPVSLDASGEHIATYATENGTDYHLRVTLLATTKTRYIHILANGPDHLDYNTREDLMLSQSTTGTESGYWAYFPLEHGTAKLDGGDWVPSDDAEAAFGSVKLIRNFARVQVKSTAANFKLTGFRVYNTAKVGSFAMPTGPAAGEDFDPNYAYDGIDYLSTLSYAGCGAPSVTDKVGFIRALPYPGYMVTGLEGGDFADSAAPTTNDTFYLNTYQYVYESPNLNTGSQPYIIIRGQYGTGNNIPNTYYKIEFSDENGNRVPIYRNLDYTITLTAVGKAGETNPANATTSNGNVSRTAEELSEISDGISGLYTLYTEKSLVIPATMPEAQRKVTFSYQYVKDLSVTPVVSTKGSFSQYKSEEKGHAINLTEAQFESLTAADSQSGPDADKFYSVTFPVKTSADAQAAGGDLVSSFVITGTSATGGTLYRTIRIRVIPIPTMTVTASGGSAINADVTLSLALSDNLPASIFPLTFNISDNNQCLNPKGSDMPVVIDEKTHTFSFVKTVTLSEYSTSHTITCALKRIKTGGTTINVTNEYCGSETCDL